MEITKEEKWFKCNNCAYEWKTRLELRKPMQCPKCKTLKWDEVRK